MILKKIFLIVVLFSCGVLKSQESLSITLDQAKEIALENNANMVYSQNELQKAKDKVWEYISTGLPQLKAGIGYQNYLKQGGSLFPGQIVGSTEEYVVVPSMSPSQSMSGSVDASMLIFDGGYIVSIMAAKVLLKISELSNELTTNNVLEATTNAYVGAIIAEENYKIVSKNLETFERDYEEAKSMYNQGIIEEQTLQQLEIVLHNRRNISKKAEREKKISYMNLSLILRKDLNTNYVLVNKIEEIVDHVVNKEMIINRNIIEFDVNNNTEYKIAKSNTESNELMLKYEKMGYLPQLSTSISYQISGLNNQFGSFFQKDQIWFHNVLFGVRLSIPIFTSFNKRSKISQAKINLEKAKIEEAEKEKQIRIDLEEAKSEYEYALDVYRTSKENLKLSESINIREKIKNKEGVGTSMDLTTSYGQLYRTQQEYLNSMFGLISSKAKIDKIINNNKKDDQK